MNDTKKGKLSNIEKYTIKGMLADNKSNQEIAEAINRSETIVNNYVNKELATVVDNIVKAKVQAGRPEIPQQMYAEAINIIIGYGFKKVDAENLGKKTIKKLTFIPNDAQHLSRIMLSNAGTLENMTRETANGNNGVTIMTQAASALADESRSKNRPSFSSGVRDSIHKTKT